MTQQEKTMNAATKILLNYSFWKLKPNTETVGILIALDADVTTTDEPGYGWTPLHKAAEYGTAEAIDALVAAGADVEARDKDDWTPLHWAAGYGTVENINVLLDAGADVAARTKYGRTPADMAKNNHKLRGSKVLKRLAA